MVFQISRLLIVEDDLSLQARLKESLADNPAFGDMRICDNLREAKQLLHQFRPEVVLLDVGLPDGNGLELLVERHDLNYHAKMLILSGLSDEQTIVKAIQLGAEGYLLKQDSKANIEQALTSIMQGIPPLSPSVAQCIMQHMRTEQPTPSQSNYPGSDTGLPPVLPPRQQMTLSLLARGMTYREIAGHMDITFNTVSTYAQEIYNKLAARSRSEAVYKAQKMGIISATTH